ncbi:MAG: hypothetical protein J7M38_13290 [Armatimonadetes bacterium]|nr:hypothetical protein [Armatimonadota bacterium]
MSQGPPTELEKLHQHLMSRWVLWGLVPLAICVIGTLVAYSTSGPGPVEGKQAERLAFEIVLGVGAALFLAAFYIDGYWTAAERIARRIYVAAEGDPTRQPSSWAQSARHRTQLQQHAHVAFDTIKASAGAMTLMGAGIGLAAIVAVIMGLNIVHGIQMLLLGLFYQLFIFSRHPYYERVAEAAFRGELLPPDQEDEDDGK